MPLQAKQIPTIVIVLAYIVGVSGFIGVRVPKGKAVFSVDVFTPVNLCRLVSQLFR